MKQENRKTKALIAGAVALLATAGPIRAQSGDAILDLLIKKGVITQREANEVREQADVQMAQSVALHNKMKTSSWLDSLLLSGDLRLRAEYFSFEHHLNGYDSAKKAWKPDNADRLRYRYRLRLGLEAELPEWATLNFRLSSGEAAPGDPVSVNQSLGNTWQKKPINIDVAALTIHPPGWEWVKVIGGKMDVPVWQPKFASPMMYDFDDTPEGLAEQINFVFGDQQQYRLFGNFGQFVTKEFSKDTHDSFVFDFQGGAEAKFGGDAKTPTLRITGAGGYFFTHNLACRTSNGNLAVGDSPNLGNATQLYGFTSSGKATTNTLFLADYNVINARAEIAWNVIPRPFLGTPALFTVSGEYDVNIDNAFRNLTGSTSGAAKSGNETTGWTIQAAFGEAKKKGQWQIAYQYKHLEADAVWDAITDSDWGNGGTDRKGHVIKGVYNITDWWQIGCNALLTQKISNRDNSGHNTVGLRGQEHLRLQVETVVKF